MLFPGTKQVICVLVGIKRNGFAIGNLASCDSVGWLRRKALPAGNLITVIKEQRHERHRFDALDSDDLKYHSLVGGAAASVGLQFFEIFEPKASLEPIDEFTLGDTPVATNFDAGQFVAAEHAVCCSPTDLKHLGRLP
jgi:hypothetical protein